MTWDASHLDATIREGDYFDVGLPNSMRFPSWLSPHNFDILNQDGKVIAKGQVTAGADGTGGNLRVTFTKAVENQYNVKGTMRVAATLVKERLKLDGKNGFDLSVNGVVKSRSGDVHITGPVRPKDELLLKWGYGVDGKPNQAQWTMRINHSKQKLTNAVITDSMENSDESFIPDSFKLTRVRYNEYGEEQQVLETIDLAGKLTFGPGNKTFKLTLGDISDSYKLRYRTTYTPGTYLPNKGILSSSKGETKVERAYQAASSGGNINADLASKIRLIKVDAEDKSIKLANAVFEVTAPDGSTFDLTTGPDGTVTSDALKQGSYKVREKTAPKGYLPTDQVYTLTVTKSGGAIKTVTNERIKTRVPVQKDWVGPRGTEVTVRLLADGADTGRELRLSEANGWKGAFEDLPKHRADGGEIAYTVTEAEVSGVDGSKYDTKVEGDALGGFTITNTNTEKTRVPVQKDWVGPRGTEVTVRLLADGADTGRELRLSEANGWKGAFEDLPKHRADGGEIAYTVTEAEVSGVDGSKYDTKVEGDALGGFTITNT
ncbi:Cna B-type domain-containing protein, partial [Berryella wangjianweii]|uniref:Cna B-type domain-containing protein n=1 Tax=Berryella wangjianweii TaxID=2734634 RepID=UPI0028F6F90E